MKRTWLVLDVSYLAYRALYSTGGLEYNGKPTGVLYGVFREVFALRERFGTDYVVWCFDCWGERLRNKVYPGYKDRSDRTEEEKKKVAGLHEQIVKMYREYLPKAECRNSYLHEGFEADDIIAAVCMGLREQHEEERSKGPESVIIVSADKDLYQLLRNGSRQVVKMYNPRTGEITSKASFTKEWGIEPKRWVEVKSIAGCGTDNIKGVAGVKEITAVKYLLGQASELKVEQIEVVQPDIRKRNLPLVSLPFNGRLRIRPTKRKDPGVQSDEWQTVFRSLGIKRIY